MSWTKLTACLEPILAIVGEAPGCFFEGFQEVQAPRDKGPCDGDGLDLLGWHVDLSHKLLAPFARPHNLNCVVSGRWPVKTLLESFTDHAPWRGMMSAYSCDIPPLSEDG
jgi:hypothetical protein